jgi:hypothetical protein
MGGGQHLTHKEVPKKDNASPVVSKADALSIEYQPIISKTRLSQGFVLGTLFNNPNL